MENFDESGNMLYDDDLNNYFDSDGNIKEDIEREIYENYAFYPSYSEIVMLYYTIKMREIFSEHTDLQIFEEIYV